MCSREMPRYVKKVHALQIAKIEASCGNRVAGENEETDGDFFITPVEEGYAPFKIPRDWFKTNKPEVGGFYIVHSSSHTSYCTAEEFENEYDSERRSK